MVVAKLLMLPFASTEGVTWSDAVFTATSAVTMTGLAVVDTGSVFTFFGQLTIAVLIQLGRSELMTFAVIVMAFLGQSI